MSKACFYVEIRRYEDDTVVKRIGPLTEHRMERVDDGANINLDHERYYTMTVTNETGIFPDDEEATS